MKAKIINIGNSRGFRLPKDVIKQYNIEEEINIELTKDGIVITPSRKPRDGWREMFAKADTSITQEEKDWMDAGTKFDEEEWTW